MWRSLAIVIALTCAQPTYVFAQDGEKSELYGTDGFLGRISRGTEEVDRCVPPTDESKAERTARAADHYDRGLVLYEEGNYARAIDEFVVSYCDAPHPSAFYNIGQSYERLLAYEKAVAYFERYILEADEAAPNRKRAALRAEVLKKLPATIRVATEPPGALVILRGSTGVTARSKANSDQPILVRKGSYTMQIELAGYESVSADITAQIGQPYSYTFGLEPVKSPVRIDAEPGNARIFLNRRLVGFGSYVDTVAVGTYEIMVEAEGHETGNASLEVVADQTASLDIELKAQPTSGRTDLIWASGIGLAAASTATFDTILDQGNTVSVSTGLVGLGLGLGGAYLAVPRDISRASAWYIIGSTAIGATEGALITSYFSCKSYRARPQGDSRPCSDRDVAAGALVGSVGGAIFAATTSERLKLDGGDVAALHSGAVWGGVTGSLLLVNFDSDRRIREPMLFAGLNLGLVAGATLAARSDISVRRMALIDLAGVAGLVGGFAAGQAVDADRERLSHMSLIGMGTGLIAGTLLSRKVDQPGGRIGTIRTTFQSVEDSSGNPAGLAGISVLW